MLEYFEAGGDAVAKLGYERTAEPPPPPPEPFAAEYFDNSTLAGSPVLTRTDNSIDFDWGAGASQLRASRRPLLGALDEDEDLCGGHLPIQRDG